MDVTATQAGARDSQDRGRYTTIDSYSIDDKMGKSKRQFQRRLQDIFRQEKATELTSPKFSGRKSLVDLYDKDLSLV